MFLAEVRIDGFRCFSKAVFLFQPGFNVVVGRNNTGKTSAFNAIRHALGSSASRGDPIWLSEDDFCRDCVSGERGESIAIELIFDGLDSDDRARFFELLDYDPVQPEKSKARLVFEAYWPRIKRSPEVRRWGGASTGDRAAVPPEVLAQVPVTFLPALRDAEAALTPGNRSRLALLLQDLARRKDSEPAAKVEDIFREANARLEQEQLLQDVRAALRTSTGKMAGTDYAPCSITASPPRFDRILRTLRVQMDEAPIEDISSNGLGYNNLLYVATVLAHLQQVGSEESPLLLVEEPEAHLHPQLTILLAEYLNALAGGRSPQIIVTSHSPTLASHIPPSRVSVTYLDPNDRSLRCNSLAAVGLSTGEERELRRMMDVTRSTLYFAKGIILVEGICEALLVPVLASRLGCNLLSRHISVVPICGVAFGTFAKVFSERGLNVPVAIITDGDPQKTTQDWTTAEPRREGSGFARSPRVKRLLQTFEDRLNVKVFVSSVTLEYDLAAAGPGNAKVMTEVWETCFDGAPHALNQSRLASAGDTLDQQALAVWRGICVAETSGSKAEFANKLADVLMQSKVDGEPVVVFHTPLHLRDAIQSVWNALEPVVPTGASAESPA